LKIFFVSPFFSVPLQISYIEYYLFNSMETATMTATTMTMETKATVAAAAAEARRQHGGGS
jgi:hypothetical protein